ncbi:ATP-binding cassette domain-containing protein [Enterococcus cecorum]|uniref:ATP-binding cassette domain-containing protein n=1 Tax=Enterococcus cecorum TaxID=44008 RepID=UPI003F937257
MKLIDKKVVGLQVFLFLCMGSFEILTPYTEGVIINQFIHKEASLLVKSIAALAILFLAQMTVSFFQSKMNYFKISQLVIEKQNEFVQSFISKKTLSIMKYDQNYLHQRVSEDIEKVLQFVYISLPQFICGLAYLAITLILMSRISLYFLAIFVGLLILYLVIYYKIQPKMNTTLYDVMDQGNRLYALRNQFFQRILEIKSKGSQQLEFLRLHHQQQSLSNFMLKHYWLKYFLSTTQLAIALLAQLGFFVIGAGLIFVGRLSVGFFIAIMQYFMKMLSYLEQILSFQLIYQEYQIAKSRMNEILNLPEDDKGQQELSQIEQIQLSDVNIMIKEGMLYKQPLTLNFVPGNIYQLVGENGVGKSTLLYTLIGVYQDIFQGRISYNGYSISEVNTTLLREKEISMMLQNEQNQEIAVGEFLTTYLSMEELEKILSEPEYQSLLLAAQFSIRDLLSVRLSELSGGQRQLLQFLVAVTKPNTSLLILDEPFSNLHDTLDKSIVRILNSIKEEKIVLLVTHRTIDGIDIQNVPII